MKNHNDLINKKDLADKKTEIFIFRYDPAGSFESMFEDFWEAVDGKKQSVEPHIVRSNNIEALATNMTKTRLKIFEAIVKEKPVNVETLANLLHKNYTLVRRDVHILEGMGIIKLERTEKEKGYKTIKPIPLYKRIVFDFPIQEKVFVRKPVEAVRT
jgi:predicted transcriptional regulator